MEMVELAKSQVGIREATGKNDGPRIAEYLKVVGLGPGFAWCAAFVSWLHEKLGIDNPRSAWSPDWFKSHIVFSKFKSGFQDFIAKPAQVFGLWFSSKKRVAHVGIIIDIHPHHYETIEGNTSLLGVVNLEELTEQQKQAERESIWVARKLRNKRDIALISDYIN